MNLYELQANNFTGFWGESDSPTGVNAVIIAQKPDCSAFLVLSETDNPLLIKTVGIPAGYDYTYRQEWGLVVDSELIARATADIVNNSPGKFPLTERQLAKAALEAALDAHIDSVAKAKGYDSRITATMRAGYLNPWQEESIAFGQWMDACYVYAYGVQQAVQAGTRQLPTAEELIAELPVMVWPT